MKIKTLGILSLAIWMAACATPTQRNGGKLSEAMTKSSGQHQSDRVVSAPHSAAPEPSHRSTTVYNDPVYEESRRRERRVADEFSHVRSRLMGTFGYGQGVVASGNFSNVSKIDVAWSALPESQYNWALIIGLAKVDVAPESPLSSSIYGLNVAQFGARLDRYFASYGETLRPFASVAMTYDLTGWRYQNSLQFQDGSSLNGDQINGVGIHIAAGLAISPIANAQINFALNGSYHFFSDTTFHGFENDVISSFPMLSAIASLSIRF